MKVDYIAQPEIQLGRFITELLDGDPAPCEVVFVSAFVSLQTIMRVKHHIIGLRDSGAQVRFVLGIDLGGTSQEVLAELLKWDVDVRVVKHRLPGHTFHPKLYVFRWEDRAVIIAGSNNITEGGFFGNYEGAALIEYELPAEDSIFERACEELRRFIEPDNEVTYQLSKEFVKDLVAGGEVPTEAEARGERNVRRRMHKVKGAKKREPLYGVEPIEPPPPLPAELLERLVKKIRQRRKDVKKGEKKRGRGKRVALPVGQERGPLIPAAFYMTLPTLQGETIPGEARIPLEAIELAKEFWGWPEEYSRSESPREGKGRIYWNWRPKWRIWSVEKPSEITVQNVRMYMYENSSDFRFYVRALIKAGGDRGDVVRIQRSAEDDVEFECVLARRGTREYEEWINSCTQAVQNSPRRFGYA